MSDLGRAIGKPPGVFQRGLNALEDRHLITSHRQSNKRLFKLNTANPFTHEITRIAIGTPSTLPTELYLNLKSPSDTSAKIFKPHAVYEAAEQKILIIAGPNGAGKTTFAREFLQQEADCHTFINADYIAHGLSPFSPETAAMKAGRIMLSELEHYTRQLKSIALETTLSGHNYARMIPEWQKLGYRIKLIFLSLPSVELAITRVTIRVQQGGHNIPEETIRRRYETGRRNFDAVYKTLVDAWALYDSSGDKPVLIERGD